MEDEKATETNQGLEGQKDTAERETEAKGEATVPDMPDVPTDEPKEPGQPEHKKARLDEGEQK